MIRPPNSAEHQTRLELQLASFSCSVFALHEVAASPFFSSVLHINQWEVNGKSQGAAPVPTHPSDNTQRKRAQGAAPVPAHPSDNTQRMRKGRRQCPHTQATTPKECDRK
ncbi:MAG: hypothetical protein MI867_26070, partial [Pseudomonadales bacterium]|nr:hypothetical protein [Pseudomonadales bacterium]